MNAAKPRQIRSIEEYFSEITELVFPDSRGESVTLRDACGRVLATDVHSTVSIPGFDNSAMDGYAVRSAECSQVPVRLSVTDEVPAGSAYDPDLAPGGCVQIMTGAPMPTAADAVVPVEDTDRGGDVVTIAVAPRRGAHVRRAGEDLTPGVMLAQRGMVLTPGRVGLLAGAGLTRVQVRPRPRVAVAATGDELVPDGSPLNRGQIYESNSWVLAGSMRRDGAEVIRDNPVPDTASALARWLDERSGNADLLVLTGGASVGAYDVVRDVLVGAGGVFRHVRMQPGKPQGWALWNQTPVLALPGNPVSAAISYQMFIRPLLDRRLGREGLPWTVAVAGAHWSSPVGRRQLVPVVLRTDPTGVTVATPTHQRGSASHLVSALADADAIARVGEEVTAVHAGDRLEVQALS